MLTHRRSQHRNLDVANLRVFADTNKYATRIGHLYVVYSYGDHFPMFVCDTRTTPHIWWENEDGYSRTTPKHKTQCRPLGVTLEPASTHWLRRTIEGVQALADVPF